MKTRALLTFDLLRLALIFAVLAPLALIMDPQTFRQTQRLRDAIEAAMDVIAR